MRTTLSRVWMEIATQDTIIFCRLSWLFRTVKLLLRYSRSLILSKSNLVNWGNDLHILLNQQSFSGQVCPVVQKSKWHNLTFYMSLLLCRIASARCMVDQSYYARMSISWDQAEINKITWTIWTYPSKQRKGWNCKCKVNSNWNSSQHEVKF